MRHILLVTAGAAALSWCGIAGAQTADAVAAENGGPLDIIVTGEKAARSLQDTVTSVAVTTPRRVEEENILTLQDVFQRTANVTETYGVSGFTIRGIANRGISSGGDGALATVYVDGAALPSTLLQAAPTDMWDVGQAEILRGPQSTLQGLNALAGAVIVQTAEPTMEWTARARAMYTDADDSQFAAALGGPIVPGELAFRLSADKRDSDGFTYNPTRKTNENPLDSLNLRGKLLWTPSSLPGFEARLGYVHYHRYGGYAFSYTDIGTPDFYNNRVNTSDQPNDSNANTDIGTLDLRYALGSGLSLSSVSSYNIVREFNRYDNDMTAASVGGYHQRNLYKTFSQELRLNYEGERLSGLLGAFYYNQDRQLDTQSRTGVPTPVGTIAALLQGNGLDAATASGIAALYAAALPEILVDYHSDSPGRVQTMAIFADGRFKLTDQLSILAGFRYDHEKNRVAVTQETSFAGTYPDPANYGAVGSPLYLAIAGINTGVGGLVASANGEAVALDRTFEAFLPKLGVEMAWTDDVKTAFTVQRGYRSGGSSSNIARSTTYPYDPEYTWNYELSFRSAWLGGALTLNANAFYVDWTKQQTSVNFGLNIYDTHTVNAGRSHIYGFEIEAAHRISPGFDWYAALGHSRTKFDEFKVDIGTFTDLSGLEFAYAPHWTLTGGANMHFLGGFNANVNANYRSAVFSEASAPQSDTLLPSRTLVNARIGYEARHWSVSAFATNLFDKGYIQYGVAGLPRAVLGNPRVLGIAIEAKW